MLYYKLYFFVSVFSYQNKIRKKKKIINLKRKTKKKKDILMMSSKRIWASFPLSKFILEKIYNIKIQYNNKLEIKL